MSCIKPGTREGGPGDPGVGVGGFLGTREWEPGGPGVPPDPGGGSGTRVLGTAGPGRSWAGGGGVLGQVRTRPGPGGGGGLRTLEGGTPGDGPCGPASQPQDLHGRSGSKRIMIQVGSWRWR